jgi:serine/threonine-protein kinase
MTPPSPPASGPLAAAGPAIALAETSARQDELPPQIGKYRVLQRLGEGATSEVYLARDEFRGRTVAIKRVRVGLVADARESHFQQRFFAAEAALVGRLQHPNVVQLYDAVDDPVAPYLVMEYVPGCTLRRFCRADSLLPLEQVVELGFKCAMALGYVYRQGLIHRDVKPANIMISKTGAVKVMDFGIARALADASSVTQTAAVIGTAQYLSPEQARGEKVDARSDVYSLGCVLYEILTGEPPFIGDSPVAVAYQHVREDPIPPSERHPAISPELDAVVLKSLAKNPDNRYQTAAEMRADLIRVHSGETPDAPKVLTDAERTSLLASTGPMYQTPVTEQLLTRRRGYGDRDRGQSVGRWLIAVAALAVLTVVVTIAINMIGGNTRDVQVPDVSGQASADAVVALQNAGFKTRTQQKPDSKVPPRPRPAGTRRTPRAGRRAIPRAARPPRAPGASARRPRRAPRRGARRRVAGGSAAPRRDRGARRGAARRAGCGTRRRARGRRGPATRTLP